MNACHCLLLPAWHEAKNLSGTLKSWLLLPAPLSTGAFVGTGWVSKNKRTHTVLWTPNQINLQFGKLKTKDRQVARSLNWDLEKLNVNKQKSVFTGDWDKKPVVCHTQQRSEGFIGSENETMILPRVAVLTLCLDFNSDFLLWWNIDKQINTARILRGLLKEIIIDYYLRKWKLVHLCTFRRKIKPP